MVDFSKIAKSIWHSVGRQSAAKVIANQCAAKVRDICREHGVSSKCEKRLCHNCYSVAEQLAYAKLNGESIDVAELVAFLRGEFLNSVLAAAYSARDSKDFMKDIVDFVDNSYYDAFAELFTGLGYSSISSALQEIKIKLVKAQDADMESLEDRDHYEEIEAVEVQEENFGDFSTRGNKNISTRRVMSKPKVRDGMTDEEEYQFIDDMANSLMGKSLSTPKEAMDTIAHLVTATNETIKFCEIQKTKRAAIRAEAACQIHQIDAMKECIQTYLEKTFDERREIFKKEFEMMDKAFDSGNMQALSLTLDHITSLAKESPFKNLSDMGYVQEKLLEKGSTFDI